MPLSLLMMRCLVAISVFLIAGPFVIDAVAQPVVEEGERLDADSRAVFTRLQAQADREEWAERSYGEIVEATGRALMGQPYVDGMLDVSDREILVADLTRFDCVLFVENVLAVANGIATGDQSVSAYLQSLEVLRYREGERDGYCSRLHYFSEWIADNEARGRLDNVTSAIGGERFEKQLAFMGTHRASYPRLADSDSLYACILDMERGLDDLELSYIPQDRIAEAYPLIETGDVIATATRIGGLDVSHTGFAVEMPSGKMGFLHASLSAGEVIISPDLQRYVQGIDHQVGIVVARPVDPRASGAGQVDSD